jgi:hypothetical protein
MTVLIEVNEFEQRIQRATNIAGIERLVDILRIVDIPPKLTDNLLVDIRNRAKEINK